MVPLAIKDGLNPSRVALPHTAEPTTALDFLRELISAQRHRHPEDDEAALLERFAAGEVVDDAGRPFSPSDVIRPGRYINFYRRPAPERAVPGQLRLLFQDANLLVVDKPPFMATLPRGQHIVETALVRARRQFGIPELSPAHRLDRLTRGVLMFTVRPEARGPYQRLFDERVPEKTYEAVTVPADQAPFEPIARFQDWREWPAPTPEQPWLLRHHMVKERGRLATYLVEPEAAAIEAFAAAVSDSADASPSQDLFPAPPNALTKVVGVSSERRALATAEDPTPREREVLVWELVPETGKTHQLRVALRSLGLPILNDPLYEELSDAALLDPSALLPSPPFAGEEDFSRPMELTAQRLRFQDPLTGELREFSTY